MQQVQVTAFSVSHVVIASVNVPRMTEFFEAVFAVKAHYANEEFSDFVLQSGTRVAFFKPIGKSAQFFSESSERSGLAIGITVSEIGAFYERCLALTEKFGLRTSGPPKEHPWGEPSFLLIDGEGNRWEVTQSPSSDGMLINRPL